VLNLRPDGHAGLLRALASPRLQRFIGVIYRSASEQEERLSHYAETELARQYDAYVWFDRTQAVHPLVTAVRVGVPEMYPFGV
jgi:erythromycin esterase-like protein